MKLYRNHFAALSVLCSLFAFSSCWDDNESETIVTNYYNAIVTAFSLSANSQVCDDLTSYSFTIDNYGTSDDSIHRLFPSDGIIFNPDSLPVGTIPDSLKVSLTYSSPDSVYFQLYDVDGKLGQYANYANDSALFFGSYPDSRLTLVSYGGVRKTYHVKINVHKVKGDTVVWRNYTDAIWSLSPIVAQRTDTLNGYYYWYAQTSDGTCTAKRFAQDSEPATWNTAAQNVTVENDYTLDLSTLYHWHGQLYAISNTGCLMSTSDGYNWSIANRDYTFVAILGNQCCTCDVYGKWNSDSLNTLIKTNGELHFAVSADANQWNKEQTTPAAFPVSGFTRPISTEARSKYGNLTSRLYITGGRTADGTLVSSTWSCDGWQDDVHGANWVEFPQAELPAMEGASVLEYAIDSDEPKTFWLLQPGITATGIPTHRIYGRDYMTTYYSQDNGVSWHRLSRYYTAYADNSAIEVVSCSSAFYNPADYRMYFFGGTKADGTQKTAVWGGVINSLNFSKLR